MISVQILCREEWEKRLRGYGCYPQDGLTPLNTAEWWRWPFKASPFTVSIDQDGHMDIWAYQKIMHDMATLAPVGWEFADPYNDPKNK